MCVIGEAALAAADWGVGQKAAPDKDKIERIKLIIQYRVPTSYYCIVELCMICSSPVPGLVLHVTLFALLNAVNGLVIIKLELRQIFA